MLSLVLLLLLWSIDLNMYGNLRNTSSGSRRIRRLTNVILGRFRCDIYRFACAFREIQANVWMIKEFHTWSFESTFESKTAKRKVDLPAHPTHIR